VRVLHRERERGRGFGEFTPGPLPGRFLEALVEYSEGLPTLLSLLPEKKTESALGPGRYYEPLFPTGDAADCEAHDLLESGRKRPGVRGVT
jgi:hypothetical protein